MRTPPASLLRPMWLPALGVVAFISGCATSPAADAHADPVTPSAPRQVATSEVPPPAPIAGRPLDGLAGPQLETADVGEVRGYDLQLVAPQTAQFGSPITAAVTLRAREQWKLSLDYPIELVLEPSAALSVPQRHWKAVDAVAVDEQACEFAIPVQAGDVGDHTLRGEVRFAVCQANACVPVRETIQFDIRVNDHGNH